MEKNEQSPKSVIANIIQVAKEADSLFFDVYNPNLYNGYNIIPL